MKQGYPGNWFDPRTLEFGIRLFSHYGKWGSCLDNIIIATAGIHVYSKKYNVTVLGNICVHLAYRKYRRKSLSKIL